MKRLRMQRLVVICVALAAATAHTDFVANNDSGGASAAGAPTSQMVNLQIGVAGAASITTGNDGGLDDAALPTAGATGFHFTVTADPRDKVSTWDAVLAAVNAKIGGPGAFHVCVGDIDPLQPLRDKVDLRFGPAALWFPVVGNHEEETPADMAWIRSEYTSGNGVRTPLKNVTNQDGPPGCVETTYSWDYGPAHLIVLNQYWNGGTAPGSDVATDGDTVPALYDWLAADLAENAKPVVFVFGHEPAFPFVRHVGDSLDQYPARRDAFWSLLETQYVQTFFCGHTHFYSRYQKTPGATWQVDAGNAGNVSDGPPEGQTFVDVIVTDENVRYETWRNVSGSFALAQTWTQSIPLRVRVGPAAIARTVNLGDPLPNDVLSVSAVGPGTVRYMVSEDADWFRVWPTEGESTGEADAIDVIYELADRPAGQYSATVTVSSDDAVNSPRQVTVAIAVESVSPDFDGDADVDLDDFGHLQACLTGEGTPQNDLACLDARLDTDLDVDAADLAVLQRCVAGANVQADRTCDD